jgi:hypothetical protein
MIKQNFSDWRAPNAPNAHQTPRGIWCNLSPPCTNCTIYLGDGAVVQAVQAIGARYEQFFARKADRAIFANPQKGQT